VGAICTAISAPFLRRPAYFGGAAGIGLVLDELDEHLNRIAKEKRLETVERWRWDEPAIRLSWFADDAIGRNVQVLVNRLDAGVFEVVTEVNAWKDSDVQAARRVRHWQHEQIPDAPHVKVCDQQLHVQESLPSLLQHAFSLVASWNLEDLSLTAPLPAPFEAPLQ
jgi:hypothetical protein